MTLRPCCRTWPGSSSAETTTPPADHRSSRAAAWLETGADMRKGISQMRVIEVSHGQPEAVLPTLSSAPARYGNRPARPSARPAGPRTRYLAHQYAAHLGRPPLRTADGHSHDLRR